MSLNFNTAKAQRNFEPIPDGIYPLHLTIKPGGTEPDGWGKESKDGQSIGLDCEFTVVEGEYANRKIFQRLTIAGEHQNMRRRPISPGKRFVRL
jgi:hypothetical protein